MIFQLNQTDLNDTKAELEKLLDPMKPFDKEGNPEKMTEMKMSTIVP